MTSLSEIQNMSNEELAAENKKLVRKLVTRKFVMPLLAAAVVHVAANILVKKFENSDTED